MKKRKYETPSTATVPVNPEGMLLAGSQGSNTSVGTQDVQTDYEQLMEDFNLDKVSIKDNPFFVW